METHQTESDDSADYYGSVMYGGINFMNEADKNLEKPRVVQISRELNWQIKSSEEYRRYRETRERLMENPALYDEMNTFRRKNFELQNRNDGVNKYDAVRNLALEYMHVLNDALVNDFLMAEQRICRLMQEVYKEIAEDIEFDYDYMNNI